MSYINIKLLKERGLDNLDYLLLLLLKQNSTEDLSDSIEGLADRLPKLNEYKLMTHIKPKSKKQNYLALCRLSEKGKKWLEDFNTPNITDKDVKMYDFLCQMYLSKNSELEDKEKRTIGNSKLCLMYCSQFRNIVGLNYHEMYYLCDSFLREYEYTKVLEYIFFKRKDNPYGKFASNINDSKLYQYYVENKDYLNKVFNDKIK